ncbi:IS200/IS605 family transposase [Flammeovirga pacifica]|uniref:Transposase IS200-like domain-containing protein n=1 Tax=Flammeovirga pacifica TaxID=915059 RepID=A0A1S1YVR3_FLAPC|nr:IS200/IS605 family transposase [Flammeovirga pacifica]OHX65121.1 hypothetical protein NH26_01505 [Flammeovirga pacifica]
MPHQNSQLWFHIIWTTKNREPVFTREMLVHKLAPLLILISKENEIDLLFMNGYKEHLHCLVRLRSTQSIARVVQKLKGVSGRRINEQCWFPFEFNWQVGYSAFSVSPDRVPTVINYIKKQWDKHQKMDFSSELNYLEQNSHHHQPTT